MEQSDPPKAIRQLVFEEIRRVVAEAIENREMLRTGTHAARIAKTYSSSGMSADEIADEMITMAVQAGVTTEMSHSE